MKQVRLSLQAQVAYMVVMGFSLLLVPNLTLPLFQLNTTSEVWVRIIGALALTFSSYYYACIKTEHLPFYRITVWGRYFFCSCLIVLALTSLDELPILIFAFSELSLTIWTHVCLKKMDEI
jgi:hypothetical protein